MNLWHRFIHPITAHFRKRRGQFLLDRFPAIRDYRICDLGGSCHFWEKLDLGIPVEQITIYNIDSSETGRISGDIPEEIAIVLYDGRNIPAGDKAFDLLVCNSVLEHVPPEQRHALVAEMHRVAKRVFFQTPAFEFFIEPHFIAPFVHWLPRSWGFQLIKISPWRLLARPDREALQSYWWGTRLLSRREVQLLFPYADIVDERVLGMTKSYYIIESSPA